MRAVFFDAGGTLVHVDWQRVAKVIARVLGRRVTAARLAAGEYAGRDAVEEAMADGGLPDDSSRWGLHFRATLADAGLGSGEYRRVGPAILSEHRRRHLWTRVVPGTAEALSKLAEAGWLVACISNADGSVDRLLAEVGLLDRLAFVVDSGKVGVEKPDRRIFDMALERSGADAAQSFYVGDVYPVDVVGSRGAGLTPILLDPLGRYAGRDCRTAPDVPAVCRELVSLEDAA